MKIKKINKNKEKIFEILKNKVQNDHYTITHSDEGDLLELTKYYNYGWTSHEIKFYEEIELYSFKVKKEPFEIKKIKVPNYIINEVKKWNKIEKGDKIEKK